MQLMFYRFSDYWDDTPDWEEFFENRAVGIVSMCHDTWIGARAQIMSEVIVGTALLLLQLRCSTKMWRHILWSQVCLRDQSNIDFPTM